MSHAPEQQPDLTALIRRRIDGTGGIPFAEFMALCLYEPQYGYYMAPRTRIGREGDFFTSSSVHALFGRLIARQLRQMWEILGRGPFVVAEQGAGEGHLALDILAAAAAEAPDFYRQLRYRLVEISPDARARQQELLAVHLQQVDWCGLEELRGMEGCFLSNELVDAFPVHLVEKRDGELREVFVVNAAGGFAEELRPLSTPAIAEYLQRLGVALAEGSRAEINLQAPLWMAEVAGILTRGFVLTIDYGYQATELYAPYRRSGTLMCYYHHTSGENPYQRIGCQDITAHVDFTTLQQAGERQGLATLWYGEQYRFLLALGFVEGLLQLEAQETDESRALALRLKLKNLILPEGGMGEIFKVLVQGKNVGQPELLCARKLRDIPLPLV
jgi:SAM-dependent MidA family methyltransferase